MGLDQLLSFEYTASPTTLLRDVRKLAPGGWLVWERGELRLGRFWKLEDAARAASGEDAGIRSEDDWAAELRATMDAAVARQMVSDVPLGSFLSGGIDSSIIVSAMSRASTRPVKTFSIGFRNRSYDELPWARLVAQHCRTEHHEEVLEPDYLQVVGDVIEHMDQPIADFSVFPTLLVSRVARRHVTVVLSGDGGDELFAGYDAYVADRASAATLDRLPSWLRRACFALGERIPGSEAKKDLRNNLKRFLEGAALPPPWQHLRWMTFLSPAQRAALYRPDVLAEVGDGAARAALAHLDNPGADRLQRQLFCDMTFYLPENILVKVDLMGMAPSLETRVPYLDNEMIDLALRLPSRLKWKGRERKYILKRAYARDLPPQILRRGKQGFSMPLKTWLNREWNPLLHELLSDSEMRASELFEPAAVARFVREHEAGHANHSHLLWGLMVFQLWRRRFLSPARYEPRAATAVKRDLGALAGRRHDLAIVGGGIYGVCAAWEAARRGLSVCLLERGDFGGATSSQSLKVVHGGLRYLQHADLRRFREGVAERRSFLELAPHLVDPLPFLIPTYGRGLRSREAMALALLVNDVLSVGRNPRGDPSKRIPRGRVLRRGAVLDMLPGLAGTGLTGGALWYDCQTWSTERLLLAFLTAAVEAGAAAANQAEVIGFLGTPGMRGRRARARRRGRRAARHPGSCRAECSRAVGGCRARSPGGPPAADPLPPLQGVQSRDPSAAGSGGGPRGQRRVPRSRRADRQGQPAVLRRALAGSHAPRHAPSAVARAIRTSSASRRRTSSSSSAR